MKFKRFLALALVVILVVCLLCSCAGKAERVLKKADKKLSQQSFKISYDFSFTYSDSYLKSMVDMLNNTTGYMIVDGDKVFTYTEIKMPTTSGQLVGTVKYTFIDDYVYSWERYTVAGKAVSDDKCKVFLTDEQREELLGESGNSLDLNASYFIDPTYESKDGKQTIKCESFSDDFAESIKDIIVSAFESYDKNATIEVKDPSITINLTDKEYTSAVLECKYIIESGTKTYKMTMEMNMTFDVSDEFTVEAPEKLLSYPTKEYDKVFNK